MRLLRCLFAGSLLMFFSGVVLGEGKSEKLVAAWGFEGDGKDSTENGLDLTIRGRDSEVLADGGRRGGGLVIERGQDKEDSRQGAFVKDAEALRLPGAFTLEMWVAPGEWPIKENYAVLVDKKYYLWKVDREGAHTGYCLSLHRVKDETVLEAGLGFGEDSLVVKSEALEMEPGQWHHVAFTYDGAGECRFYVNSRRVGKTSFPGRPGVSPGNQPFVIGDRVGSTGYRFVGAIDEVKLWEGRREFRTEKVLASFQGERSVYVSGEEGRELRVQVFNDSKTRWPGNGGLQIDFSGEGGWTEQQQVALPNLKAGERVELRVPLHLDLRAGDYEVQVSGAGEAGKAVEGESWKYEIVGRRPEGGMPVIMWGTSPSIDALKEAGYTGQFVRQLVDSNLLWEGGKMEEEMGVVRKAREHLDHYLAEGIDAYASLSPARWVSSQHPEFNRKNRKGEVLENINGLHKEVQGFVRRVGEAVGKMYREMPAMQGALIHTEVRDRSMPGFEEIDRKAYRAWSGEEIPEVAGYPRGVSFEKIKDFPKDRLIEDDNPIRRYYEWYWREGDGWNGLHTLLHRGLKEKGQKDWMTWFDPAVRAASLWGSGGEVDVLNQWTYTYPNPLKNDLATAELFAMARGRPQQQVMKMVQLIWYREQTTGEPIPGAETEWEKVSPEAEFITISPDHLSEGTWLELAYPVRAIANHGWGCLGDKLGYKQGRYVTTNLETRVRAGELSREIVAPLGPTLLQVPDVKSRVGYLQSFTSQMFAKVGNWGWGRGWDADAFLLCRYAGLQPDVLYEEEVLAKNLEGYEVLVMAACPVLTKGVAQAIQKFRERGGIVIGDEDLAPGVKADFNLKKMGRRVWQNPEGAKEFLLGEAERLAGFLDGRHGTGVVSKNREIVTRVRGYGTSRYVFTVNDKRDFGDYVGQYGKVMEVGLPVSGKIRVDDRKGGAVYDLVKRREVKWVTGEGDGMEFEVALDGGGGGLFLLMEERLGGWGVKTFTEGVAKLGERVVFEVELLGESGKALDAVVPLMVEMRGPGGMTGELSGYYGVKDGRMEFVWEIPKNELPGLWKLSVREGLTGSVKKVNVRVEEN